MITYFKHYTTVCEYNSSIPAINIHEEQLGWNWFQARPGGSHRTNSETSSCPALLFACRPQGEGD